MAPPHAAALAYDHEYNLAHDPVWQAALNAPPALPDALSPEERAGLEVAEADIRAGRCRQIPPDEMRAILEQMRRDQGDCDE